MLLLIGALLVIIVLCWVLVDTTHRPHEPDDEPLNRHDRQEHERSRQRPHHHV